MIIACCSFGKDSLAAIMVAEEHGMKIDRAVYVRIMFDDDTPAEPLEHDTWIHDVAIPILRERYGIETDVVTPRYSYKDIFYKVRERGKYIGRIHGFPMRCGAWCNSQLKVRPLNAYIRRYREQYGASSYVIVGIASDEPERIERKAMDDKILPLVSYDVTEAQAYEMCERAGLLSPIYKTRKRTGCWFCHNQRLGELRMLRRTSPELWEQLLKLDADSDVMFRQDSTVRDLDRRFALEDAQIRLDWAGGDGV